MGLVKSRCVAAGYGEVLCGMARQLSLGAFCQVAVTFVEIGMFWFGRRGMSRLGLL